MTLFYGSMLLTVLSNITYQICQRAIRPECNPVVSLMVTYAVAWVLSTVWFKVLYPTSSLVAEVRQLNWASVVLGIVILGLELGFLLAYRAGWKLSLAALTSNILVTIMLLPIGILFYRDQLTLRGGTGAFLSLVGLALMVFK